MPRILEEKKLMFKVHAGKANTDTDTEEINLSYSLQGTPIVTFEDGTTVYWEWQELLEQAVQLRNDKEATTYECQYCLVTVTDEEEIEERTCANCQMEMWATELKQQNREYEGDKLP